MSTAPQTDVRSPADPDLRPDKRQVRRAFDRAAAGYDRAAVLQQEVGTRLVERLDYVRLAPRRVLDLGSGTGLLAGALANRYPRARILQLDLSLAMLRQARGRSRLRAWLGKSQFAAGDAERLPLASASFDLVLSNLVFQWCEGLGAVMAELRRVLRPGGLVMFTTFGPDTLGELRRAWAQVDGGVHVSRFPDMHDVGDLMVQAGLADPVMDMEPFTLTYDTVQGLMRDLKAIGASNAARGRARGLTGKGRLQALGAAYEGFRREGRLPATYEVVYGHAWAPAGGSARGRAEIRVEDVRRR